MNCHKVQSLISAYVDSELSGLEMLAIRQHLNECDDCRVEFESLYGIKKALGRMTERQPSKDLASRICMKLDHAEAPRPSLLAELRKHLIFHPAKVRLATAGVGAFAMLFMLRAGGVAIDGFQIPSTPEVTMSSAAYQPNGPFLTIPASVETPMGTMPIPDDVENKLGLSHMVTLTSSSGSGGFSFAGTD